MELRPEVKAFAEEMEKQLRANEHKGGWKNCDWKFLHSEMDRNASEMLHAIYRGGKAETLRRCANIANFAMMMADNYGGLGQVRPGA